MEKLQKNYSHKNKKKDCNYIVRYIVYTVRYIVWYLVYKKLKLYTRGNSL